MFNFEKFIATARFAPYINARSDVEAQRALYLWNCELAQELSCTIGHIEVFVREAIDCQLRDWNERQPLAPGRTHSETGIPFSVDDPRQRPGGGTSEWLKYPAPRLANLILTKRGKSFASEYDTALARAEKDLELRRSSHPRFGAEITHDDVIAHMTLGTWVRLLPEGRFNSDGRLKNSRNKRKKSQLHLWSEALSSAFPFEENPYVISHRLSQGRVARNRVAHQESLLNTDVPRIHRAAIRLALAIDPGLGSWLANESKVIECWKRQP